MSVSNTTKRVKEIRCNTRREFSSEEKIRIVLEGLRGECSIAELCRREGINGKLYYRWSKDFLEAGKKYLAGDIVREANSDEVIDLRKENCNLRQAVAELPGLRQESTHRRWRCAKVFSVRTAPCRFGSSIAALLNEIF